MWDSRKYLRVLLLFGMLILGGSLVATAPVGAQGGPHGKAAQPPPGKRMIVAAPSPAPAAPTPQPGASPDPAPGPVEDIADPMATPRKPPLPPASPQQGPTIQVPALPDGPLFLPPEALFSEQRSIETALVRSPLMRVAREKVASAVATYQQQQSNKNFQFVINNTVYAQQEQRSGIPIPGRRDPVTTDALSSQFTAMMQILLTTFGNLENKIAAAFLNIDVANRNFDTERRSLILSTKQAFFNHLKAVASVATARLNLENCQQTLDDSRQMFAQGLLSKYDVVQAELQVTQAEQRVAQGRTDTGTTRAGYLATLYLPDDTPFRLVAPNPIVIDPSITVDALKRVAVEHRPELQSYDRQLAVARKILVAAQNQSRPTMSASFGYQTYPGSRTSVQDNLVLQLTFAWSAVDGGLRKAQVASAQADIRSLQAQTDQQRVQIRLQVDQAWLNYQQSLYNLRTAFKQVETAGVYYDMARQRYLNALGTSLETQDALRSLNEARINLVSAMFDRDLAFAQIEQALGVDFPDRRLVLPPPAPQGDTRK